MTGARRFFGGNYHSQTLESILKIRTGRRTVSRRRNKMRQGCREGRLVGLREKLAYRETAARKPCHCLAETMKRRRTAR